MKGTKPFNCRTEMIPRTVEFVTSMARMGGMLTVMIPRAEYAWLNAVILDPYKKCPALDRDDRRRYLNDDCDVFNLLSAS